MQTIINEFNAFFKEIEKKFIGRETEIANIKLALLTREHVLLRGSPGTAKSLLVRTIFHHIVDGQGTPTKPFEIQFSKFMSEDYVFGPINIKKLREHGIIEHNTQGSIVEAKLAFIDEFFDGSDVLIRSLLEILNERTFTRNAQQIHCPLHTAVLTSNYVRDDESVQAILDRILFKSRVRPLDSTKKRVEMYEGYLGRVNNGIIHLSHTLPYDHIEKLSAATFNVQISTDLLEHYDAILKEYVKQTGKYISDRTANKALNVVRANALLNNHTQLIEPTDFYALSYVLCGATDDKDTGENDEKEKQIYAAIYKKIVADFIPSRKEIEDIKQIFGDNPIQEIADVKQKENLGPLETIELSKKIMNKLIKKHSEVKSQQATKTLFDWIKNLKTAVNTLKEEIEAKTEEKLKWIDEIDIKEEEVEN